MNPFAKIRLFYRETVAELGKTAWPKRKELRDMTIVVIIAVALIGLFVALSDFALYNVVDLFTDIVRYMSA